MYAGNSLPLYINDFLVGFYYLDFHPQFQSSRFMCHWLNFCALSENRYCRPLYKLGIIDLVYLFLVHFTSPFFYFIHVNIRLLICQSQKESTYWVTQNFGYSSRGVGYHSVLWIYFFILMGTICHKCTIYLSLAWGMWTKVNLIQFERCHKTHVLDVLFIKLPVTLAISCLVEALSIYVPAVVVFHYATMRRVNVPHIIHGIT